MMTWMAPAMAIPTRQTPAANRTVSRTVKPTSRLMALSPIARMWASIPAPGAATIRFHGANKVLISVGAEKDAAVRCKRRRTVCVTRFQPVPYHQRTNATANISLIVTLHDLLSSFWTHVCRREHHRSGHIHKQACATTPHSETRQHEYAFME